MTLEQALEKANEGGWKTTLEPYRSLSEAIALALLDPLFWQAIFPACGCDSSVCNDKDDWKDKMIGLTRHLAEGKSIEEYFKNL